MAETPAASDASTLVDAVKPDIEEKLVVAREKKDVADQAFKSGDLQNGMQ